MAVTISEQLFKELCANLASRSEEDEKADYLFNQLQEVEIEGTCAATRSQREPLPPKEAAGLHENDL